MPNSQDYIDLRGEFDNMREEIKHILDRFKLFGTYTQHDYDCALGDIRELVG